jgi:hypothetical protein
MPPRLGLFPPRPFGSLHFQGLPSLGETRPERLVSNSARRRSKTAAFIGTTPELFYNHVTPFAEPARSPLSGRISVKTVPKPKHENS